MWCVLLLSLSFRSLLSGWFVTRYGLQQGIVINKVWTQPYSHFLPITRVQVYLWFKQSGQRPSYTHTHTYKWQESCFLHIMYLKNPHRRDAIKALTVVSIPSAGSSAHIHYSCTEHSTTQHWYTTHIYLHWQNNMQACEASERHLKKQQCVKLRSQAFTHHRAPSLAGVIFRCVTGEALQCLSNAMDIDSHFVGGILVLWA